MYSSESEQLSTRHSIVFNTLVAFVVIIGFSLMSLLGSLYLADALEGDAEAINHAGSLRMQTYRLAFVAEQGSPQALAEHIAALENTLESSSLRSALHRHRNSDLPALHATVLQHWQQRMRPLLDGPNARLAEYRQEAHTFVSELDVFVHTLQERRKASWALSAPCRPAPCSSSWRSPSCWSTACTTTWRRRCAA
ncbi:two-component sensor NarX [Pseudomonas sp. BAY1663]|nr:two-component sensor NarX [Pseudomonas sp. BAY1663]